MPPGKSVGCLRYYLGMDPRPVEVLHKGRWWPGWVRDQRQEPDGQWRALVTFTVAGEQFYRWEPEDRVRPRD